MIKAIIADVDGVMVGMRQGVNFPMPTPAVLQAMQQVSESGVPIILCSAKYFPAITPIIETAQLNNPHITDAGALIIDPLGEEKIIQQAVIPSAVVQQYVAGATAPYTELCTADAYYVEKSVDAKFLRKRAEVVQYQPTIVDSLVPIAASEKVIKIISFVGNEQAMPALENYAKTFQGRLHYIWSGHPYLLPWRPVVMTAPGVSKATAAQQIIERLHLNFEDVLGIGDSSADWLFMELCGSVATVGDRQELQALARAKPDHYIGGSVDDDAMIDILKHFNLLPN